VPTVAYVNNSVDRLSFAVGLVFPHGSGAEFDSISQNPLGNPKEGQLYSMEIIPTIAFEVSPYLSLGASLRVVRIDTSVEQIATVLSTNPVMVDTATTLDASGWDVGAAFGLMIRPADWLNIGANFRTKLEFDADGQANLATAGATDITLEQTLPALFTAGFGAQVLPELLIAFQYGYEKNSQVEEIGVSSNGQPLPAIGQNYKDSHTYHVGVEYKPTDNLGLLAGYAQDFDESIPDTSANRIISDVEAKEYSLGIGYQWTPKFSTNFAFNRRFGSRTIEVDGTNNIAPGFIDAHVTTLSLGIDLAI
jgi:long-chain fatty acid transport protein